MFCPLCKTEYREGFYTCADCSVPLVPEIHLTEEQQPKTSQKIEFYTGNYVEVFQSIDQSDCFAVKLAFDAENIPNNFSGDFPLGMYPGRLARFFVPTEFEDRALDVVRNLNIIVEPLR